MADDLGDLSDEQLQGVIQRHAAQRAAAPPKLEELGDLSDEQLQGVIQRRQQEKLAPYYQEAARNEQQAFNAPAGLERLGSISKNYLLRQANPLHGLIDDVRYGRAQAKFNRGEESEDDLRTIAKRHLTEQIDAQRSQAERFGGGLASIPGQMAMLMGGGRVAGAIGAAAGIPAAGGGAAGFLGRTAVQATVTPNLGFQAVVHENIEQGRDPLDPEGVPAGMARSMAEAAVLQGAGEVWGRAARALPGGVGRFGQQALKAGGGYPAAALTGPINQQITDATTYTLGLNSHYGRMEEIAKGKYGEAASGALLEMLTFAAMHAMHGGEGKEVVKGYTEALDSLHDAGLPIEKATQVLKNPTQTPPLPGPAAEKVADYAQTLAEAHDLQRRSHEGERPPYKPPLVGKGQETSELPSPLEQSAAQQPGNAPVAPESSRPVGDDSHGRYVAALKQSGHAPVGSLGALLEGNQTSAAKELIAKAGKTPVFVSDGKPDEPAAQLIHSPELGSFIKLNRSRPLTASELAYVLSHEGAHAARAAMGRRLGNEGPIPYDRQPHELSANRLAKAVSGYRPGGKPSELEQQQLRDRYAGKNAPESTISPAPPAAPEPAEVPPAAPPATFLEQLTPQERTDLQKALGRPLPQVDPKSLEFMARGLVEGRGRQQEPEPQRPASYLSEPEPEPEPPPADRRQSGGVADVTLGPPKAGRHISGETINTHKLLDAAGREIGEAKIIPRGENLHVEWIGMRGAATGEAEATGKIGRAGVKSLLNQIAAQYPTAATVSGLRGERRARISIPRQEAAEAKPPEPVPEPPKPPVGSVPVFGPKKMTAKQVEAEVAAENKRRHGADQPPLTAEQEADVRTFFATAPASASEVVDRETAVPDLVQRALDATKLSPHERDVIELLARGNTHRQIAQDETHQDLRRAAGTGLKPKVEHQQIQNVEKAAMKKLGVGHDTVDRWMGEDVRPDADRGEASGTEATTQPAEPVDHADPAELLKELDRMRKEPLVRKEGESDKEFDLRKQERNFNISQAEIAFNEAEQHRKDIHDAAADLSESQPDRASSLRSEAGRALQRASAGAEVHAAGEGTAPGGAAPPAGPAEAAGAVPPPAAAAGADAGSGAAGRNVLTPNAELAAREAARQREAARNALKPAWRVPQRRRFETLLHDLPGATAADLHQTADDVIQRHAERTGDPNDMLKDARETLSKMFGDQWKTLAARARNGELDSATMRGVDVVAADMEQAYPHLFNDTDHLSDQLFEYLLDGKAKPLSMGEAYAKAAIEIADGLARQAAAELRQHGYAAGAVEKARQLGESEGAAAGDALSNEEIERELRDQGDAAEPAGGSGDFNPAEFGEPAGEQSAAGEPGKPGAVTPKADPVRTLAEDMARDEQPGTSAGGLPIPGLAALTDWITERIQKTIPFVRNETAKLAGRMFPATTRLDRDSGEATARFAAARTWAKYAAPDYIDRVIGPKATEQERRSAGAVVTEMHLRHTKAAYQAIAANPKTPMNAAIEARLIAQEVKSVVGVPGSPLKDEAAYQAGLASDFMKGVISRWKAEFAPVINDLYRRGQGLDITDPIESFTQIKDFPVNLKAVGPDDPKTAGTVATVGGARGNLTNVRQKTSVFARQRKGNAPAYDIDLGAMIENSLARAAEVAAKREMFDTMQRNGLAERAEPGLAAEGYERLPGVFRGPKPDLYVHRDALPELRQALAPDKPLGRIPLVSQALTTASILSTVELAYHAKNQLTFLMKPGVRPNDLFNNAMGYLRGDPDVKARLTELARIGAMKPPGLETGSLFSGAIAEKAIAQTGPQSFLLVKHLDPSYWSGKILDGLGSVMRLTAADAFDRLAGNKPDLIYDAVANLTGQRPDAVNTETAKRDFINQLGQYEKRAQSKLIVLLRDTGIGPFATAGSNYYVQGIKGLVGAPGVASESVGGKGLMIGETLAKTAAVLGAAALANYLAWGKPDGDDGTPAGAIKLGEKDGKTISYDLADIIGLKRGMRSTGLLALTEGERQGKGQGRITDKAADDAFLALVHPAAGPPAQFAYTAKTGKDLTGREIAARAAKGESQTGNDLMAALRQANPPLHAALGDPTKQGKNEAVEEKWNRLLGPFGVKFRPTQPKVRK